jgi:hypothetical protein
VTTVIVLLLLAVTLPAVGDQLRWLACRPHWLLVMAVWRRQKMRNPAVFHVQVDPAKAGLRRHALREDRHVSSS